jgi:hypothetical protein
MVSINDFSSIAALDLDPIKVKLMHKESGEGWTLEYANTIEFEYRRFLYLMKIFPNEQTAPLFDVDIFWHYHILDTMKYAADCESIFGYFLHHFPYVGLRGEEDEVTHQLAGNRMRELYEHTFGDAYICTGQKLQADTQTAWSTFVPRDAMPQADTRTAWSTLVPRDAMAQADTRTAWSTFVPRDAMAQADTRTAWSTFVPRDAMAQADTRTAWSTFVPRDAMPWPDASTSLVVAESGIASDRAPHTDPSRALQMQRFYSIRPVLEASN